MTVLNPPTVLNNDGLKRQIGNTVASVTKVLAVLSVYWHDELWDDCLKPQTSTVSKDDCLKSHRLT